MNRLILLGNGFDLAHGLKTGYTHFIKWYIAQSIHRCSNDGEYKDGLLEVSVNDDYRGSAEGNRNFDDILYWVNQSYNESLDLRSIGPVWMGWDGRTPHYPYIIKSNTSLLDAIVYQCNVHRWVDVEAVFYRTITRLLQGNDNYPDLVESELRIINDGMRTIIENLRLYLLSLPAPQLIQSYFKIFSDYVHKDDLESLTSELSGDQFKDHAPNRTMVVNFNYTSTFEQYYSERERNEQRIELNYLHGTLTDSSNPIVFGFGDELDRRYEQIEQHPSKGWFEHIKSFWYLRTRNYQNLIRFVDGEEFQILVLGHSCGLSDRTMLHMLFEHVNCRSLKVYYWGTEEANNYTDTTFEIARHFKDKALMRKRIVKMPQCERMPQHDDA
ncbi:AbiH family protein [Mucilaginibacter sp. BT774]|uniref:AbiH family protein n=1 Tax=Mucilaginibacter sp. BT774 TaxID=3062276 RepID=UPI0026767AF2|nr:AbiH family protein [Mucilaginibacter sp. BT774]MDO3627655.1 AbiH family protein [Mucilaginibacter sp. BT774]